MSRSFVDLSACRLTVPHRAFGAPSEEAVEFTFIFYDQVRIFLKNLFNSTIMKNHFQDTEYIKEYPVNTLVNSIAGCDLCIPWYRDMLVVKSQSTIPRIMNATSQDVHVVSEILKQ